MYKNIFKVLNKSLLVKKIDNFNLETKLRKDTIFIPIVIKKNDIFYSIKHFFKNYENSIAKYIEIKQFRLTNPFNLTNKKYYSKIKSLSTIKNQIKKELPNMTKPPVFNIVDNYNSVLNLSEFFNFFIPSNNEFYRSEKVKKISQTIFHDIISYLSTGKFNNYISRDSLIIPENINLNRFQNFIYSFEVNNIDTSIITKSLNLDLKIINEFKKEKNNLMTISLFRGLLNFYSDNLENNENLNYLNKGIIFLIHNKKSVFIVNINELKYGRKLKYGEFKSRLVKCFKRLIIENGILKDKYKIVENNINDEIDNLETNAFLKTSISNIHNIKAIGANILVKEKNILDEDLEDESNDNIDDKLEDIEEDIKDEDIEKLILEEIKEEEEENYEDDEKIRLKKLEEMNKPKYSKKQLERIEMAKSRFEKIEMDNRTTKEILEDVKSFTIELDKSDADIRDKSMNEHLMLDFDKSYIKNTMKRHMLEVVNSFSTDDNQVQLYLQNVKIEDTSTTLTEQETWEFEFEDNKQKKHKFKVDIPKIDEDGFMYINGNRKNLKKQILTLPIVKETPVRVSVMSNFNKCFVTREGKIPNRKALLLLKILDEIEYNKLGQFKLVNGNNVILNENYYTTIDYNLISERVHSLEFKIGMDNVKFMFNQKEIELELKKLNININIKPKEKNLCIGFYNKEPILINLLGKNSPTTIDIILAYINKSNKFPEFDTFIKKASLINARMFSRITYQSRKLPLVIFLSSIYGLKDILKICKIDYEFSQKPIRDERRIYRFKDGYFAYSEEDLGASLLLNGLNKIKLKEYNFSDMNTEIPYLDFFQSKFGTRNLIKGFKDAAELMFKDPITLEILKQLNLPTDFLEIFLYANELLTDDEFTHNSDVSGLRIRSYEIIPVLLYKAMVHQYLLIKQRSSTNIKMSIPQNEIFTKLHHTGICDNFYKLNPLSAQKAKSDLTFKGIGVGGVNNDDVFTLEKRSYGKNAIGIVTLSNVDSGKVGIVKQLSSNPNITSTLGLLQPTEGKDSKKLNYNQIHGPSECAVPFIEGDSPPRVTFMDGQTKHTIPTIKNRPYIVSNGFSKATVEKMDQSYVKRSKKKGKVTDIKNEVIEVTYDDGTKNMFDCKKSIEKNENFYLELPMKINVSIGDTVNEHTILAYNDQFVYKNSFGELELAQGPIGMFVLTEGDETEEDSSILFEHFSKDMSTPVTNVKTVVLEPSSNILAFKKIGDKVIVKDQLVSFENAGNVDSGINELLGGIEGSITDEQYSEILTKQAKANMTGTIVDLDVHFSIPIEEMSETCADFVKYYFSILRKKMKNLDPKSSEYKKLKLKMEITEPVKNRIKSGIISEEGGLFIEYYISHMHPMLPTDKLSINSSIKSVIQAILPEEMAPIGLETNTKYCGNIGSISISNRKVTSVFKNGFTGTIIRDMQKRISDKFLN